MDVNIESISHEVSGTTDNHSELPVACVFCQRVLSSDNEGGDLEVIGICGDCKFLLLEDVGTPVQGTYQRRTHTVRSRRRRRRDHSSESIENIFSQQFSHMINLARQNQHSATEHENQSSDGDTASRLVQRSSSRSTSSRSRRWRRVFSDTESDGVDSIYGESESNASVSGYRLFHGESDTLSYSAYGGHSDASVDGHSFDIQSDLDSDTDIDPMNAGVNHWISDDHEENAEEGEDDNEWEEVAADGNTVQSLHAGDHFQRSPSPGGSNVPANWHRQLHSAEVDGTVRLRIRNRRQEIITNVFANLAEHEMQPYVLNSGDYLDARGFDEMLEQLAQAESSQRGAPPAAVSVVNRLPQMIINEEHLKQDGLACAICKDSLLIGTLVNQLPCRHLYHPYCILPWLSARNSCPLCRYELPTDDKDYEDGKQNAGAGLEIHAIPLQDVNEDSLSDSDDAEVELSHFGHRGIDLGELVSVDDIADRADGEGARGRWFFLAAAPVVSLVGIVLVFWLRNPQRQGRGSTGRCEFPIQQQHPSQGGVFFPPNQRETNRSGRWWSFF